MPIRLTKYSKLTLGRRRLLLYFFFALVAIVFSILLGIFSFNQVSVYIRLVGSVAGFFLLLAIWSMPEQDSRVDQYIQILLAPFLLFLFLWPPYISIIKLPGNPWLSPTKILLYLISFLLLISLSTSTNFKTRLRNCFQNNKIIFKGIILLTIAQFLSIFLSASPVDTFVLVIKYTMFTSWLFLALVGVINSEKWVHAIIMAFVVSAIILSLLAHVEYYLQDIIWVHVFPSWMYEGDEIMQKILTPGFKAGVLRVKVSSITPLEYAEFLALSLPFCLYYFMEKKTFSYRIIGFFGFFCISIGLILSGSRLGIVASIISVAAYGLIWGLKLWRTHSSKLFGPFIVTIYPTLIIGFLIFIAANQRVMNLVIGGGETAGSNQARIDQWLLGLSKIIKSPILGFGYGNGARVVGWSSPSGKVSIDSYYLSLLMDTGIWGLVAFITIFGYAIFSMLKLYFSDQRHNLSPIGIALSSSLIAFMTAKIVLSQPANHPIAYMLLALVVIIVAKVNGGTKANHN